MQGHTQEAEKYVRRAIAANASAAGEANYMNGYYRSMLAMYLLARNAAADAAAELEESLRLYRLSLPADHPYIASSEHLLGEALLALGEFEKAEATLRAAIERCRRAGAQQWRIARSESALGEALFRQGHAEEGTRLVSQSYRALAADPRADKDATLKAKGRVDRFLDAHVQENAVAVSVQSTR